MKVLELKNGRTRVLYQLSISDTGLTVESQQEFGVRGRPSANWKGENDARKFRKVEKISRKRELNLEKNDTMMCFFKRSKKSDQHFPLFDLPLHIIEKIVSKLAISEMARFKQCCRQSRKIVDGHWQLQKTLRIEVGKFCQLFPHMDAKKQQFESLFHIRNELGRYMSMLPKHRLVDVNFTGIKRFHHEMLESILARNALDPFAMFSEVTSMDFELCTVSCADLESLSYYTPNLKSLTISDQLIDHKQEGEDVDPSLLQCYRTYQRKRLIGHRSKLIAHLKTLWPSLVQLTFTDTDGTVLLDEFPMNSF